jgi:small subunit ribosomal protein S1
MEKTNEMDVLLKVVQESDEQIRQRPTHESWEKIYSARQNSTILKSEIRGIEKIDGRVCGIVWIGNVKGIIPLELSGFDKSSKLRDMVGQDVVFKVVMLDRQGETFVANRKEAVEHQQGLTWDMLKVGQKVIGRVIEVAKIFLVVDVGGVEVRLTVDDLSYEWIDDFRDKYTVGQEIIFRVNDVDKKEKKLKISHKDLLPNPWPDCTTRIRVYNEYLGTVSGNAEYGVFVNLEPGVDCLSAQPSHGVGSVKKGDKVLVKIFEVSVNKKRITGKVIRKI